MGRATTGDDERGAEQRPGGVDGRCAPVHPSLKQQRLQLHLKKRHGVIAVVLGYLSLSSQTASFLWQTSMILRRSDFSAASSSFRVGTASLVSSASAFLVVVVVVVVVLVAPAVLSSWRAFCGIM